MSDNGQARHTKVLRLRILKPAGGGDWKQLGSLLRDARYRVFRLANLAVSETYLGFHLWRRGLAEESTTSHDRRTQSPLARNAHRGRTGRRVKAQEEPRCAHRP